MVFVSVSPPFLKPNFEHPQDRDKAQRAFLSPHQVILSPTLTQSAPPPAADLALYSCLQRARPTAQAQGSHVTSLLENGHWLPRGQTLIPASQGPSWANSCPPLQPRFPLLILNYFLSSKLASFSRISVGFLPGRTRCRVGK